MPVGRAGAARHRRGNARDSRDHARAADHLLREFRGEIATVIMQVDAIRAGLAGPVLDLQERWLVKAIQDGRRVVGQIDDYRDLAQMEEGTFGGGRRDIDLSGLVGAFFAEVEQAARGRRATVVVEAAAAMPRARIDGTLLSRTLGRMGRAFVDCARPGDALCLRAAVAGSARSRRLVVELCAPGAELPQDVLDTVFDRAGQERVGLKLGRGYSMLFCREAARWLGGSFRLRPWPGRGTRAVLVVALGADGS
jgi:signal transduction histidine kinase